MSEHSNTGSWGLSGVKRVLFVSSGKGGVGKSQMAVMTAMELWRRGLKVGLLDLDLCGPSIPTMLGLEGETLRKCDDGYLPIYADHHLLTEAENGDLDASSRLKVVSMGFLLPRKTDGVAWKDPKKTSFVLAVLQRVKWGELDALVIDLPPGITGEKLTVAQHLREVPGTAVVVVTSPQMVALSDVRKEIEMWRRHGIRILGLLENMSGLTCPACGEVDHVFSHGGARVLAEARNVPFMGSVPLDPAICQWSDQSDKFAGKSTAFLALIHKNSRLNAALTGVADGFIV